MDPKLIDEINRLFDELVHLPWSRVRSPSRPSTGPRPAALVVEIPLKEAQLGSVSMASEGRRVTVVVATRSAGAAEGERGSEEHRQTFEVPEGTRPAGFEAHWDGNTLRVRIELRSQTVP